MAGGPGNPAEATRMSMDCLAGHLPGRWGTGRQSFVRHTGAVSREQDLCLAHIGAEFDQMMGVPPQSAQHSRVVESNRAPHPLS